MNSYLYVNYSDRFHKRITRHIIANIVKKFSECIDKKIDFIGMGSLFFEDFITLYETGSIANMKSIEYMLGNNGEFDEAKYKRFLFNRPYDSIEIIPKMVRDAVLDIKFDNNCILWLDYEEAINRDTIEDMAVAIRNMKKTGLLVSATNTFVPFEYKKGKQQLDVELVREKFADIVTPENKKLFDEISWDNYNVNVRDMVDSYYKKLVVEKCKKEKDKYELIKLSRIEYRDSARYVLDIWALIDINEINYDKFKLNLFSIPEIGNHKIDMVVLTKKEIDIIKNCKNENIKSIVNTYGIDEESINQYIKYRKYHKLW